MINRSTKDFGLDFITSNLKEKTAQKAKKKAAKGKNVELFEYDLDHLILREDGGAVLVGEQYYMRVTTSTTTTANGGTTTRTTYHYYYNDIIVVNIDPSGNIQWAEKIPKRQYARNDNGRYSSYAMAVVEDRMYFVFNDNPKNLFEATPGKTYNMTLGSKSIVTLVEMNSDGRFSREALFTKQDAGVYTKPKLCEQIGDNELVIFGLRKKNQRFMKATFKGKKFK